MKKYIIILLLVTLAVVFGVYQIQSQIETQNKNVNEKHIDICDNKIKTEVKSQPIDSNVVIEEKNNNSNDNDYIIMQATAYTRSREEGTHRGITRCGTQVSRGTVAVDPRMIPLGTKLYIEGYGEATALDTGGDIKHDRIDLYMESKEEAFKFGRKNVKVYIIK